MTDPELSPPGMTPVMNGLDGQGEGQVLESGVVCNDPQTWPQENQQLGAPPYACQAAFPRCDDPNTWSPQDRELGVPPSTAAGRTACSRSSRALATTA